jgi:RNA polymerase sigma factor (sigma-70 family)
VNRYQLFSEHQWIIRVFVVKARTHYPILEHYDELESELAKELWGVALRFDPSKGAKFSTFSYWRLGGAMIDLAKRVHRQRNQFDHRRKEWSDKVMVGVVGADADGDPYEVLFRQRMIQTAMNCIQNDLGSFARDVVTSHLVKGISLRGIARHHGCSYSRVRASYLEAVEQIRGCLGVALTASDSSLSPG